VRNFAVFRIVVRTISPICFGDFLCSIRADPRKGKDRRGAHGAEGI
jgi:hypothetical protein